MNSAVRIGMPPAAILRVLCSVIAALMLLHGTMVVAEYGFGAPNFLKLRAMFDMNREQNIPTMFSATLLVLTAFLLVLESVIARRRQQGGEILWAVLAAVFAFLAVDEFCQLHEKLIQPLRNWLQVSGALSFAWVIPYAGLVLMFGACYLRFWWRLPSRTRRLFAVSASIYVGAALGLEMVGSKLFVVYGWHTVQFDTETLFEEGLEMSGVALFLYAICDHLASQQFSMDFDSSRSGSPKSSETHTNARRCPLTSS